MSGGSLKISIANDLRELSGTAARIDLFCKENGQMPQVSFDVYLAIDELVTNTISYGYDDGEHRIDLILRLERHTLTLRIEVDGRAFGPLQAPEPDLPAPLESRASGGLGIHLVRNSMDGIEYRRQDGRNVLTLTKSTAAGAGG